MTVALERRCARCGDAAVVRGWMRGGCRHRGHRDERGHRVRRIVVRAANYWRGDDTELLIEKSTKNAYAGAESDGVTARPKEDTGAGFFGIGIVKAKHEQNVGTLWRSAWQLGAGFLFTVATRFKYEASDTTQAYKQLPLFKYDEWGDFAENSPHGASPSHPLPVHDRFITPIDVL